MSRQHPGLTFFKMIQAARISRKESKIKERLKPILLAVNANPKDYKVNYETGEIRRAIPKVKGKALVKKMKRNRQSLFNFMARNVPA